MGNTGSKLPSSLSSKLKSSSHSNKNGEKFDYEMTIVIRGEEGVGKTSLFHRLLGLPLESSYVKTTQINTGILPWKIANPSPLPPSPVNDEVNIKLEFWDVIDKSNPTEIIPSLIHPSATASSKRGKNINLLDAESMDVYEGAHAVIFILDISDECHSYYIQSQLNRIPSSLPILVFGNFTDRHQRKILPVQIKTLFPRFHEMNNMVWYSEGSILEAVGLKVFKSFIKFAFYQYQHQLLKEKLSLSTSLMQLASDEILINMSDQDILQLTSAERDSQLGNMPSFVPGLGYPSQSTERKNFRQMSPIISTVQSDEAIGLETHAMTSIYGSQMVDVDQRHHTGQSLSSNDPIYDERTTSEVDAWNEPDPWQ